MVHHLNRSAGVQSCTHSAGEPAAFHGRRIVERAVATDKLGAIPCQRARRLITVKKSDMGRKVRAVRVAAQQRSAASGHFGLDVHGSLGAQIAQDPLDIGSGGDLARAPGNIAQSKNREFDRGVDSDINL